MESLLIFLFLGFLLVPIILLTLWLTKFIIEKIFLYRLIKSDPNFSKLYKYAINKLRIKIRFDLFNKGAYILLSPLLPIIKLGINQIKIKKGLTTAILAHEIGHFINLNLDEYQNIYCSNQKKPCSLLKEIMAWEIAFLLLKKLKLEFNEEEFWKTSAIYTSTYLFYSYKCFLKNNDCPKFILIGFSKVMKEIINHKDTIANLLIKKNFNYIPENNIFK